MREVEKNKSVLYKAAGQSMPDYSRLDDVPIPGPNFKGASRIEEQSGHNIEDELTPEQLQMYEQENRDMVKHYRESLDQVRYVESAILIGIGD